MAYVIALVGENAEKSDEELWKFQELFRDGCKIFPSYRKFFSKFVFENLSQRVFEYSVLMGINK